MEISCSYNSHTNVHNLATPVRQLDNCLVPLGDCCALIWCLMSPFFLLFFLLFFLCLVNTLLSNGTVVVSKLTVPGFAPPLPYVLKSIVYKKLSFSLLTLLLFNMCQFTAYSRQQNYSSICDNSCDFSMV